MNVAAHWPLKDETVLHMESRTIKTNQFPTKEDTKVEEAVLKAFRKEPNV